MVSLWWDDVANSLYHGEARCTMTIDALEQAVAQIRNKPLLLVCVLPTGKTCTATIRECLATGGRFLHIANDELDALLGAELGGDREYP